MTVAPIISLPAGSTAIGAGASCLIGAPGAGLWAVLTGDGTISAGTAVLEESDDAQYTGTWSQITSVNLTALSGGAKVVVQRDGPSLVARWRITVAITGGGSVEGKVGG
jgi:hypothetical protein